MKILLILIGSIFIYSNSYAVSKLCDQSTKDSLEKSGYNSCAIRKICGEEQFFHKMSVDFKSQADADKMKKFLMIKGCKGVYALKTFGASAGSDDTGGESYDLVSQNCFLGKEKMDLNNKNASSLEFSVDESVAGASYVNFKGRSLYTPNPKYKKPLMTPDSKTEQDSTSAR